MAVVITISIITIIITIIIITIFILKIVSEDLGSTEYRLKALEHQLSSRYFRN